MRIWSWLILLRRWLGGLRRIVRMGGRSLGVPSVQCIDILIFSILLKNNPIYNTSEIIIKI